MKIALAAAFLSLATAHVASAAAPSFYEEQAARQEEQKVLSTPIAGIENKYWFRYRVKVIEARKELVSDLKCADDIKDRRHAWDEYGTRLHKLRFRYVGKMGRRGYLASTSFASNAK